MPVTAPATEEARSNTLLAAAGFGVAALAAVAVLLVLGLQPSGPALAIVTPRSSATPPRARSPPRPAAPAKPLFAPTSVWNTRLPATAPVDPNSAALVQSLEAEVQRETQSRVGPWIATNNSSTPLYRVGRNQPHVRVHLDAQGTPGEAALQRAFAAVPIPRNAKPAPGQDRHMTVVAALHRSAVGVLADPARRRRLARALGRRHPPRLPEPRLLHRVGLAGAAGATWGATATSLPVIGGTMTIDELERGSINHALAMALPAPRSGTFAWPAQRTDGTGGATALPEGARLRLDPQVDVASLGLPRVGEMIALAAQRYGIVVRDQTHKGISLFAEDPGGRQPNPYDRLFAGQSPLELLAKFPWDRLQVLRMHLCTKAPCRAG